MIKILVCFILRLEGGGRPKGAEELLRKGTRRETKDTESFLIFYLGVVSSAVNVICELARKNASNYLTLAPVLFRLLTRSNNNWMLIKIIKLVKINFLSFLRRLGLLFFNRCRKTYGA
jgi:hypothetical protein